MHANEAAAEAVDFRDAVHGDLKGPDLHAIHTRAGAVLVAVRTGITGVSLDARSQKEQLADLPPVQGQLADAAVVLDIRHFGALGRDYGRSACHLNNVLHAAYLEHGVYNGVLPDLEHQGSFPFLEPRFLHLHPVRSSWQRAKVVDSHVRCLGLVSHVGVCIDDGNGSVRNHALIDVTHRSGNGARARLRK